MIFETVMFLVMTASVFLFGYEIDKLKRKMDELEHNDYLLRTRVKHISNVVYKMNDHEE